ncbi:MAG: hypothetical protein FWG65_04800 [Turicibacter sp.]|nr:hypothetical protein [Turicibacter sp.]
MNDVLAIYERLAGYYDTTDWWPAKTPYEVIVGAILTQNTNWQNVEKALSNFAVITPEFVAAAELPELEEIIRPSGFYRQKAVYLKAITEWFAGYGYDVEAVQKRPLAALRAELLAVRGVGQETADSILLYAFRMPTFVVDAYTKRLCERYPLAAGGSYAKVKAFFEGSLPREVEVYDKFHALIVLHAKRHCLKKASCEGCPLLEVCKFPADTDKNSK